MNPYLEKALANYYARRRRTPKIFGWASAALLPATALGVLIIRPEEGFRHPGVAALAITSMIGIVIGILMWRLERPALLEVLRANPSDLRSLEIGQVLYEHKRGLIKI